MRDITVKSKPYAYHPLHFFLAFVPTVYAVFFLGCMILTPFLAGISAFSAGVLLLNYGFCRRGAEAELRLLHSIPPLVFVAIGKLVVDQVSLPDLPRSLLSAHGWSIGLAGFCLAAVLWFWYLHSLSKRRVSFGFRFRDP